MLSAIRGFIWGAIVGRIVGGGAGIDGGVYEGCRQHTGRAQTCGLLKGP